MDTLTKTQARRLAKLFTDFSAEISKYRYDAWEKLSAVQRQKLLDTEYNLMSEAGKISALAGVLTLEEAQGAVDDIDDAVGRAETFLKKVEEFKTGLAIVTGIFVLAVAVISKDPKAILKQLQAMKKLV